jgi:hypothetical protein
MVILPTGAVCENAEPHIKLTARKADVDRVKKLDMLDSSGWQDFTILAMAGWENKGHLTPPLFRLTVG